MGWWRLAGTPRIVARAGAVGLSLALLAGACGPAGTAPAAPSAAAPSAAAKTAAPTSAPTEAPVPVALGVVSNILNAPFFVGLDKGIYLKHGIDLKLTVVAAGTDAVKGIQGGQFQLTSTAWATIVPAVAQGVPFKLLSPTVGGVVANFDAHITLMLGPGVTASKVADLKGMTIAVAFGTAPETWLRTVLKQAGLDPDKDVKLVNVTVPNIQSVLVSKAANAGMPIEPYSSQILAQVPGTKILSRGGGIVDGRVSIIAMGPWVAQNPKIVDRVIESHLDASQYIRKNPDDAAAATSRYVSGLDAKVLAASMKVIPFDPRWGDPIKQGFDATSQELVRNGTIKAAPPSTDILVLDKLNAMEKTYPRYFTDLK